MNQVFQQLTKFFQLVNGQFSFGGTKYASDKSGKETTDILCEKFGFNGLLWTIGKYTFRYRNLKRERDMLKIATYMFIVWLKLGYHKSPVGLQGLQNTTVEVKSEMFPKFISDVIGFKFSESTRTEMLDKMLFNLEALQVRPEDSKYLILETFHLAQAVWAQDGFADAVQHDTDTKEGQTNVGQPEQASSSDTQ